MTDLSNFSDISDDILKFMHQMPYFDLEQNLRLERLRNYLFYLKKSSSDLEYYYQDGIKLVSLIENFQSIFNNTEYISFDSDFQQFNTLINEIIKGFTDHFSFVKNIIFKSIHDFIEEQLNKLSQVEKDLKHKTELYYLAEKSM